MTRNGSIELLVFSLTGGITGFWISINVAYQLSFGPGASLGFIYGYIIGGISLYAMFGGLFGIKNVITGSILCLGSGILLSISAIIFQQIGSNSLFIFIPIFFNLFGGLRGISDYLQNR